MNALKQVALGLLFACACAAAQTVPIVQPHQSFVNGAGLPCAGCSLYSYAAGTTTPLATYTDSSGGTQNPNPIILDTSGSASVWLGIAAYKFVLIDTGGSTIWTADQVNGALSGGTLTGPLMLGTTPLLDSSFYSTFAQACAAAISLNGPLYVTKSWTAIPTQSCAANLVFPTGAGGGALGVLQPASGATLTLTGVLSVANPNTQIFDLSLGSLAYQGSSNIYPDYFGAKGDGTTNDGPALQTWLTTTASGGIAYQAINARLVAGETYLSDQLLNGTCSSGTQRRNIIGDGSGATIVVAATSGPQGAGLDLGGCNSGNYKNFGVTVPGGVPANSPMETSAILLSNGHWTAGYNGLAGQYTTFDSVGACGGYNTATSNGTGTAAMVVLGSDLVTIKGKFSIGCNGGVGYGGGHGDGLLWGVQLGHATAVQSAFYTFNPTPGFPTVLTVTGNSESYIFGDYGAPVEIAGGGLLTINGTYLTPVDTGSGGSIFDFSGTGTSAALGVLKCNSINTEDQSSSPNDLFRFENGGGPIDCQGRLDTNGALLSLPTANTSVTRLHIRNTAPYGGGASEWFNLAANTSVVQSVIEEGYGDASLGTVPSTAIFTSDTLIGHIPCTTFVSTLNNQYNQDNHFQGQPSGGLYCGDYSDVTFTTGLQLNSAGMTNGQAQLGVQGNLLTWNQPFNLNGIVSGSLSNLAPNSNNFTAGTWTNSGFTITSGQPDPWGGNTATILSCSSYCTLTDTYSATPLTASTNYQACVYGSLTSGTNSFYMFVGGSAFAGGGILQTSGWGPACLPINSGSSNLTKTLEIQAPNGPTTITLYGVSVAVASTPTAGYRYTAATPQPTPTLGLSPNFAINGQPATFSTLAINGGHTFTRHTTLSVSLTPSAVAANTCAVQTLTVTGALAGDFVTAVIPPSSLSHVSIGTGMVTGSGTIAINFCGDSTGGTPPSGTWNFDVEQ